MLPHKSTPYTPIPPGLLLSTKAFTFRSTGRALFRPVPLLLPSHLLPVSAATLQKSSKARLPLRSSLHFLPLIEKATGRFPEASLLRAAVEKLPSIRDLVRSNRRWQCCLCWFRKRESLPINILWTAIFAESR